MSKAVSPKDEARSDARSEAPMVLGTGHPIHQIMGDVFEELGGKKFVKKWAKENPTEYMKMVMKLAPPPRPTGNTNSGGTVHIHLPEGIQPSPLDVVAEQ